jgi:hypothetical protein
MRTGRANLANPLIRQALQSSVDVKDYEAYEAQNHSEPLSSQSRLDHSFISNWAKNKKRKKLYGQVPSKRESFPDSILLTALSGTHSDREDWRNKKHMLASKMLGKNPVLWEDGKDAIDLWIVKMGRLRRGSRETVWW